MDFENRIRTEIRQTVEVKGCDQNIKKEIGRIYFRLLGVAFRFFHHFFFKDNSQCGRFSSIIHNLKF